MWKKLLMIAALSVVSVQEVAAQAKVGIIRLQDALLATAEMKKAQGEIQAKFKPRQDALEKLNIELQQIQQKLNDPKTPQQELPGLQALGQRKQREATRLQQDLEEEFNAQRQDILSRAGTRMTEIVKKLAEEKGLDMVVEISTTLYSKPALDFTTEVVAAYDKAYPVK